jgi:cytochrome c oxidase assembly protein subunit 15
MHSKFTRFAWFLLAYNLAVVAWGAYVRASGSGAGCGNHWPLCNGEVMPQSPQLKTIIEFTHRLTSGLDGLLIIGLVWFAFRLFPAGHVVRKAAVWSLVLVISEGLFGAAIVKLGHVAENASTARGYTLALHLCNTMFLLASIALTAWYSTERPVKPEAERKIDWMLIVAAIGILVAGATGAITALGDTLFKSATLAEGMRQDMSEFAHPFVRLRVFHPALALIPAALIGMFCGAVLATEKASANLKRLSYLLMALVALQILMGILNLILLAPVPLQILHLLGADLLWITVVLSMAEQRGAPGGAPEKVYL